MEQIIISGQQKAMLNSYLKGKRKIKEFYPFLRARINEIPNHLIKKGTDHECLMYIYKHSKVSLRVHETINWWQRYKANGYGDRANNWGVKMNKPKQ